MVSGAPDAKQGLDRRSGKVGGADGVRELWWQHLLYMAQLPDVEPVPGQDVRIRGLNKQKWEGLNQNLRNTRLFLTIRRNRRRNRTETIPPMTVP